MEAEVYNQSTFLTLKAAYLYYLQGKNQNEIAEMLSVSVPTVSRLIKKAVKDKIVEFVITDPFLACIELGEKLKKIFNLKDVVIAPSPLLEQSDQSSLDSEANMKKLVALEGARYIQRIIKENDVLGVSWGKTMYYLIHYLNPCQKINAAFVTLHGSVSSIEHEQDVRTLVSRMAMNFGGRNYSILTEGLVSSGGLARSIRSERNIKRVLQMYEQLTISLSGIGSFYPIVSSALSKSEYLSGREMENLKREDVRGDIVLRFINKEGKECCTDLKDRTLGINLEQFKNIETKITVAAGRHKTHAVLAGLKGKLIDVLITDYYLGKTILDTYKES